MAKKGEGQARKRKAATRDLTATNVPQGKGKVQFQDFHFSKRCDDVVSPKLVTS